MRKGFTLIELLVVITILAILAGAAVPYVQDYVDDSRISKAREDLGELRNAIARYEVDRNQLFNPASEGVATSSWQKLLVGPYITQALTDPWGRPYYFSHAASIIFSGAEDGDVNTNIISVDCRPAMAPTRAWWYDEDRSGAMSKGDYVDIKFTRPIGFIGDTNAKDLLSLEIATSTNGVNGFQPLVTSLGTFLTTEHPKGQNWMRINVSNWTQSEFTPGSWLRCTQVTGNKIYDAALSAGNTQTGIYDTDKIDPEHLFIKLPNTASAATDMPVQIKAAQ